MKVSIIIPTYNEEKDIENCLNSLNKQSYGDIEIILVDDGSKDKTPELLKELKSSYLVKVLKQKHKGPGAARNLGAKRAKGEILVFVDADMTFGKDFIKKLVEPIIKGKTKGTFSKEEYVSNWDNVWARCWNINEGWEDKKRHPKNYPNEQWVFRAILKSEFLKVKGFDPGGYTDDWSLGKKLGYKAASAPKAKFFHKNTDNLKNVFFQARWAGKREYKLGIIGTIIALVRSSLPVSIIIGTIKSIIKSVSLFVVFKIVYDFGVFLGILEYVLFKKGSK